MSPCAVERGDAELLRVVDVREEDLRDRRQPIAVAEFQLSVSRCLERVDELPQVLLQHVVAEVHHEVLVAEEVPRDQHAVGEAQRRVLRNVRDLDAEPGAVTDGVADLAPPPTSTPTTMPICLMPAPAMCSMT